MTLFLIAPIHWGEADEAAYAAFIRGADIGASAALHDFQGLAMLELAQAGATVVLPRRVAYPEVLPGACFYEGSASNPEADAAQLAAALAEALSGRRPSPVARRPNRSAELAFPCRRIPQTDT